RPAVRARVAAQPFRRKTPSQLVIAAGRLEDAPDDELRRDRPIPAVLLEPEGEVPRARAAEALELCAEAECDRAAGRAAVVEHAEAEMPTLADGAELCQLATGDEERHAWIAEAERGELLELAAEVERERPSRDDRVDHGQRSEVLLGEDICGV